MRSARARLASGAVVCLLATSAAQGSVPGRASRGLPLLHRYMTDTGDGSVTRRYGYDLVDTGPNKSVIDALPRGQKALVWIGDYDDATCAFELSDDEVSRALAPLARDRRVAGFYIADEADDAQPQLGGRCDGVPAAIAARSALVHRVAPGHFTYQVLTEPATFKALAHATDVVGVDPYPCRIGRGCDWTLIPRYLAALRKAHVKHYWGVLQAFASDPWRLPTPAELHKMIAQWSTSCWEGEQTFAWTYRSSHLSAHPRLLAELAAINRSRTARPARCA